MLILKLALPDITATLNGNSTKRLALVLTTYGNRTEKDTSNQLVELDGWVGDNLGKP